jgi:hypothetical protein
MEALRLTPPPAVLFGLPTGKYLTVELGSSGECSGGRWSLPLDPAAVTTGALKACLAAMEVSVRNLPYNRLVSALILTLRFLMILAVIIPTSHKHISSTIVIDTLVPRQYFTTGKCAFLGKTKPRQISS